MPPPSSPSPPASSAFAGLLREIAVALSPLWRAAWGWARQRKSFPWLAGGAALALLLLAAFSLWGRFAAGEAFTARVQRRDFQVVVRTTGELDAARSTVVSSPIRGDQARILWMIEEGSQVKAGDLLIRLDPVPFEEAIKKLETDLRAKDLALAQQEQESEWEQLQASRELKTAEFDLASAKLQYDKYEKGDGPLELARMKSASLKAGQEANQKESYIKDLQALAEQGLANPIEIEQVKAQSAESRQLADYARQQHENYRDYVYPSQLESAKATRERAQMNLEQTRQGSGIRQRRAEASLQAAERELDALQESLEAARQELLQTEINAPIPGMAVLQEDYRDGQRRKPRIGDKVLQGRPLVYLPDVTYMIVRTQVREVDLHKIAAGRPAAIFVDAFPDLLMPGVVENVGVLAESAGGFEGGEKQFQVIVRATQSELRLRPGMTCRVEIQGESPKGVLAVPIQGVFRIQRKAWCFASAGWRWRAQEVRLGAVSEDWAEIREGLSEGARVALFRPPEDRLANPETLSKP